MATRSCPHFKVLQNRVVELREKFIRDQIDEEAKNPTSFNSDLDRLAAFRLLVHAEFEEFLETKARQGLDKLSNDFRAGVQDMRSNVLILVIGSILAKSDDKLPKVSVDKWADYFDQIILAARKIISDNNGIKESSFTHLALFSGKMPDEIDMTLALSLNNYGKSRGDVAHKSASRVRTLRAPSAEAKEVEDLLSGLGTFFP
jgi:hypothetical protein